MAEGTSDVLIQFKDAKIFQQDNLILSDVNFQINKNDFVYLVGRVGSGKSSLIKTMNAELPLVEGHATIVGFDLELLKRKEVPFLRRKLGIVFQDFQLLTDRTVYENLSFVLKATGWNQKQEIDERIEEVLELVGLGFKGYKMPHQLSGGEQQRIVIARSLLNNPELILADEPTGNLDPETSEGIFALLHDLCKNGRTVVMATHNYNLLKRFNARTLKCEDGKLIESAMVEEIDFNSLG